jgi:mannosyltransferase OCH1-like enzyme
MVIPKIIHQTWKNGNLPPDFKIWSSTWRKINPDFQYKFYTDRDIERFVYKNYPHYIDLFESLITIEKIDMFRYLVLYHYGGVYVDMDCECLKPIDGLLDLFPNNVITGYEYENPIQYLQWFIACPVKCNTMIELINEIYKRSWYKWFKKLLLSDNQVVYWSTGPKMYTDILRKTSWSVAILEKGRLGCYDKKLIDRNSYLRHYFTGSWKQKKCKQLEF